MIGYIGPNGAGKSTTIKMLTGILAPASGPLRVAGVDPARERLEAREADRGRLRSTDDAVVGPAAEGLVRPYCTTCTTSRWPGTGRTSRPSSICWTWATCSTYRSGNCRWGSGCAATSRPPSSTTRRSLYLDEPTIGLDVISKARLREFLPEVNAERRTTVLLTTHDLDDIEPLCTRVMVIDHGHLIYDGTLAGLRPARPPHAPSSSTWPPPCHPSKSTAPPSPRSTAPASTSRSPPPPAPHPFSPK